MLAFLLSPIGRWLVGAGIAVIVLGGGFLWLKIHYENVGYQKALAAVAAQDAKAIEAAEKAKSRVQQCFDTGRRWNVETGECEDVEK